MTLILLWLALVGCVPKQGMAVDPTLPDGERVIEARPPLEVLEQAAANLDPTPRARALGLLIAVSAEPAGGGWGPRALADSDAWVQRKAVDALAARLPEKESAALLASYAARTDSLVDPYVRSTAALELMRAGLADQALRDAMSAGWRAEKAAWRRAPLALAAASLGDAEAVEPLGAAIAKGDVALEVDFVIDLGRSGLTALVPSLRDGSEWVEEELRLPYAVARVALGDPTGEGVLRKALADADEEVTLEALDYLTRMHDPASTALIERVRDPDQELARWYADLALAARGKGSLDLFERGVVDLDRDVRALSVRFSVEAASDPVGSSGRRAQRVARRVVKKALTDPDPEVRTLALQAIAVVGAEGDSAIAEGLTDDDLGIRVETAGAMLLLARNDPPKAATP
jgi:hypothetical protein